MRTLHTTPRAVVLLDVPIYPLLCSLSQCPTVKRSQLIEKCLNDPLPPPHLRSQISVTLLEPPPPQITALSCLAGTSPPPLSLRSPTLAGQQTCVNRGGRPSRVQRATIRY